MQARCAVAPANNYSQHKVMLQSEICDKCWFVMEVCKNWTFLKWDEKFHIPMKFSITVEKKGHFVCKILFNLVQILSHCCIIFSGSLFLTVTFVDSMYSAWIFHFIAVVEKSVFERFTRWLINVGNADCRLAIVKATLLSSLHRNTQQRQLRTAWTTTSCSIACSNVCVWHCIICFNLKFLWQAKMTVALCIILLSYFDKVPY